MTSIARLHRFTSRLMAWSLQQQDVATGYAMTHSTRFSSYADADGGP